MVRKLTTTVAAGLLMLGEIASGATWRVARPTPANGAAPQPVRVVQKKPAPASRLVRPKPAIKVESPVKAEPTAVPKPRTVQLKESDPSPRIESNADPTPVIETEPDSKPRIEQEPDSVPPINNDLEPTVIDRYSPNGRYQQPTTPSENSLPKDDSIDLPSSEELPDPVDGIPSSPETTVPTTPESRAQSPAVTGQIFRLEPPNQLMPVARDELKPGVIYLHDSPRLGRQVWSFVQSNGEFWHAFGPGTTQSVDHFAFPMTDEETLEALRKIDSKLAFDVSSKGSKIFLRLEADNTWKLVRTNSVPSIYDLETSERWEKQWGRYLPVVHMCGETWEHREGGYQAPQWGEWMRPN